MKLLSSLDLIWIKAQHIMPMSIAEAEKAYDQATPEHLSNERINEIVRYVLSDEEVDV